jgi:predicted peroxiredoxin
VLPVLGLEWGRGPRLKIMIKSAWGSDDPTKAAFPFSHAHALAEAGHEVRIFLLGEAVGLMRRTVAEAVVPVGWPRVAELLGKMVERKIPIYACGTCARGTGCDRCRSGQLGRGIRQPQDLRLARRMGRPGHDRVAVL